MYPVKEVTQCAHSHATGQQHAWVEQAASLLPSSALYSGLHYLVSWENSLLMILATCNSSSPPQLNDDCLLCCKEGLRTSAVHKEEKVHPLPSTHWTSGAMMWTQLPKYTTLAQVSNTISGA